MALPMPIGSALELTANETEARFFRRRLQALTHDKPTDRASKGGTEA